MRRHSLNLDNYDMYVGLTSSLISVDIEQATTFFTKLINNEQLREKMGMEGRTRARQKYDWSIVMKQYQDLWNKLDELRSKDSNIIESNQQIRPGRLDPFKAFSHYASNILTNQNVISLIDSDIFNYISTLWTNSR